jgi:hypothetical protein
MPPDPVANFCLRYSAHTFGDRILSWGKGKENGPFGSFAPPLKNIFQVVASLPTKACLYYWHYSTYTGTGTNSSRLYYQKRTCNSDLEKTHGYNLLKDSKKSYKCKNRWQAWKSFSRHDVVPLLPSSPPPPPQIIASAPNWTNLNLTSNWCNAVFSVHLVAESSLFIRFSIYWNACRNNSILGSLCLLGRCISSKLFSLRAE